MAERTGIGNQRTTEEARLGPKSVCASWASLLSPEVVSKTEKPGYTCHFKMCSAEVAWGLRARMDEFSAPLNPAPLYFTLFTP